MTRSTDVRISSNGATLAGTLHFPDGSGPHPALVMLQGSGPEDRDSGGYFPPIRGCFLAAGLAVLSWDKPGIGESTGDWTQCTFGDRSDEALTTLTWLRQCDQIDAERTGIWGHSQGGWIGPMTAARDRDVSFLIVNSGPGVDVIEQDLFGVEHTLRQDGASDADVLQARAYMTRIHEAASGGMSHEVFVASVMEPARGTPGFDYFGEVDEGLWGFLVRNMREVYDPMPSLERISCPVLAIFGEKDALVPVAKSVRIFEDAFAKAGNDDVTIEVFPGADHRIGVGDPSGFADGYLDTMASWLRARVELR